MGLLFRLFAKLNISGPVCPVCKEEPPEYWAGGRTKKYRNGACSAACYRNSPEYRIAEKKSGEDAVVGKAKRPAF